MKYRILLHFLRLLVYFKRFFWWLGTRVYFVLGKAVYLIAHSIALFRYKVSQFFKKIGLQGNWLLKRNFLQLLIFSILLTTTLPQTRLFGTRNLAFAGQKTQAYKLLGADDELGLEEVVSEPTDVHHDISSYKSGSIGSQIVGQSGTGQRPSELGTIVAGGTALSKPIIFPGAIVGEKRQGIVNYTVEPGDVLGMIAEAFDVSVATIMWENNLTLRSIIRPGDVLRIPPTTGVMHTVKKGDTLKKIATAYEAEAQKITTYNHLKEDGTDLVIGQKIMIPDGIRPQQRSIAGTTPRTTQTVSNFANRPAAPPASRTAPSAAGFVWPSGAHNITQYYGVSHHAIDIAGPWQTPTYASKAGVVEKAQCGWNSGYGCYIIISHGDGLKTLYGHHSQLLVSPGDYVETGQTIGLMGNTGKVRGVTGIHLHFEVQRNGVRVNPLGYVK